MHSAVMQNKKYIKFADENTVEVLALGSLEKGIEAEDRKAATYTAEDGVERMLEWPSLTKDEIFAMNRSKAGSYNKTGKIPYTAIIDPWTEKEVTHWSGGQSSKTIMEAAEECRDKLAEEHGKGISRSVITDLDEAIADSVKETSEEDYKKAMKPLEKLEKKAEEWPEPLKTRLADAKKAVVDSASARLDEIGAMEDKRDAKRELSRLLYKLKAVGLEDRARQMLEDMKED